MLEIIHKEGKTRIQPLVRYRGAWETSEEEDIGTVDWTKFLNVKLEVKDNLATLEIGELIYEWVLPTHVDVNHIEAGGKQGDSGQEIAKSVPEIPFRDDFGMIGFRAHMGQGAIIRNLKIRPL